MSFVSLPAPVVPPDTHLETITDFYQEVDRLLLSPLECPEAFRDDQTVDDETKEHAAVFDKFQNFLALLEVCYDKFLDQQYNLDYCIARLLDSAFVKSHHSEVGACILDLLSRATTLPVLLVTYDLLLAWGQTEPLVYRTVHNGISGLANDKITRLVHQIWAGHYAAVADARLGGGVASNVTKHWYARTNGRRESIAAHVEDFPDRSPLPPHAGLAGTDTAKHDNLIEISDGQHTAHHHPISQVAETSNASRTRIHQIRLRDKAIQILYEVCRVQRLAPADIRAVDEKFVSHLFDLVEETRLHEDEAFNYLLIKLIVALNEQFMVNSIALKSAAGTIGGNIVLGILKSRLHVTKTFGENLIFMLNRASSSSAEDFCMQLLVLKLLYLLFTTKETAHYFYTNDLRVLVDVFIRELSDLPEESESLRHTYLRVLHPLLTHTQLCSWPYKRPQIRRLLKGMVKDSLYRGAVSATTRRLVQRCLDAEWCIELDRLDPDYKTAVQRSNGREDSGGIAIALVQSIGESEHAKLQYVGTEVTPEGLQSRQIINEGSIDSEGPVARGSEFETLSATPQVRSHMLNGFGKSHSAPVKQPPASAPGPALLTPATLLNAPRFRNVLSARSAPSSPPPRLNENMAPQRAFTPSTETGEEEAMAFAHAQTRRQSTLKPSWQSQIASESADWGLNGIDGVTGERAREEEELDVQTILNSSPVQSSCLLAPLAQRGIARRASHGELRPASQSNRKFSPANMSDTATTISASSLSVRRPPPAPPVLPAAARKREGLPASSSELLYPSTMQYLSGTVDEEEDSWGPPIISAPPHSTKNMSAVGSRKAASILQDRGGVRAPPGSAASVDEGPHRMRTVVVPYRSSSYESRQEREREGPHISSPVVRAHHGDNDDEHDEYERGGQSVPLHTHSVSIEAQDGYLPPISSPLTSNGFRREQENYYAFGSGHVQRQTNEGGGVSLAQQLDSSLTMPDDSQYAAVEDHTTARSSTSSALASASRTRRRAPPAPPVDITAAASSGVALAHIVISPTSADRSGSARSTDGHHWPSVEDTQQNDEHQQQLDPAHPKFHHRRLFTRSRVSSDVGHSSAVGTAPASAEGTGETEEDGVAMCSEGEDSSLHQHQHQHQHQHLQQRHPHQVRTYVSKHSPRNRTTSATDSATANFDSSAPAPPLLGGVVSAAGGGGGGGQRRRPPPPPVNRSTKTGTGGGDAIAFHA